MRQPGAKGYGETNMTNAEANTAANVAEQGATVAPEQASAKKRATRKTGAPTGQKKAKRCQSQACCDQKVSQNLDKSGIKLPSSDALKRSPVQQFPDFGVG